MVTNVRRLPAPLGPFRVGKYCLSMIATSRKNPFSQTREVHRKIPLILWYPSDDVSSLSPSVYISSAVQANLAKIYPKFLNHGQILTNSYENASISEKMSSYPVILFNHGYSAHMEQNTLLMEHLASFGYILISIGHPYEGIMSFPEGKSTPMHEPTFQQLMTDIEKNFLRGEELEHKLQDPNLSFDQITQLTRELQTLAGYREQSINIWVEDNIFILDQLEGLHSGKIPNPCAHKFSFSQGIGNFGHSFGGNAAMMTCVRDPRISCAINLDGTMYGGFSSQNDFRKPLLFVYNGSSWGIHRYYHLMNQGPSMQMQIQNSKHADFMDNTLFRFNPTSFGSIPGTRMVDILNRTLFKFFREFLLQEETDWSDLTDYTEVKMERRVPK